MSFRRKLQYLDQKIQLKGDDSRHEQTDRWSNRDLIPLPPERRTWGWFNFYGFWAITSLNIVNWQTPSSYLSSSNRQSVIHKQPY
jgi:NCS1 family nucleobase:cation symporter-1